MRLAALGGQRRGALAERRLIMTPHRGGSVRKRKYRGIIKKEAASLAEMPKARTHRRQYRRK